jgi:hypothetical protein
LGFCRRSLSASSPGPDPGICRPCRRQLRLWQRRNPVPTCTADAPSISAAATPRASAIPPVAITGTLLTVSATAGSSENRPTMPVSARAASKAPRWPPASMPCATIAAAPASHAALASATVVTVANHFMPRDFMRSTNAGGYSLMIEEMTGGPASNSASHWAAKSGGVTSPAVGGTSGPQPRRNSRTAASEAGSRSGGRRIGDPQIELECAVAAGSHIGRPCLYRVRLHEEDTAGAVAAGVRDRDRQGRRAGPGRRCQQDRDAQTERFAKRQSAGQFRAV